MGDNHRQVHRSRSLSKIAGLIYLPYVQSIIIFFHTEKEQIMPCLLMLDQDPYSEFFDFEMLGWEDDEDDFDFDEEEDDLDMIDDEDEEDLFEEDEEEDEDDYDELEDDLDEDFEDDFDDLDFDPDEDEDF